MSRLGTIIQIKGMGIPVQSPSDRNQEGYEIRWSSDPEVGESSPAHVLVGQDELKRFIDLAVDSRFMAANLMTLTTVNVEDGKNSVTRAEAVAAGVNPDNWSDVRVAFVISGNSSRGPVMDTIEWLGSRQEYAEGDHLAEAFEHANHRGIKNPAVHQHTERSHIMQAAHFLSEFNRQMKPSLRAADMMAKVLVTTLCDNDFTSINADRAHHYLLEIQRAFVQQRDYARIDMAETGVEDGLRVVPSSAELSATPTKQTYSGPRLN